MKTQKPDPAKWNAAATIEDLQAAVAEISAEIAKDEARKAEIDANPGEFVLSGGDLAELSREAYDLDRRLAGYRDAREIVAGRLDAAKTANHHRLAEEGLVAAHALKPDLKVRWKEFYAALEGVLTASDRIAEVVQEIQSHETRANQLEYPKERLVHLFAVRGDAAKECRSPAMGELERHRHEADNIDVLAKQAIMTVAARCEMKVYAMASTNKELLDYEMSREAGDAAAERRFIRSAARKEA